MEASRRTPPNPSEQNDVDASKLLAATTPHPLDMESWSLRRDQLQSALAQDESPALFEALGQAGYWLGDGALTFSSRERAYHLYRSAGDTLAAARMATALGSDYFYFGGAFAVSNGWFQHALHLLENLPVSAEYGWLSFHRADLRFFALGDSTGTLELASDAEAIAQLLGQDELAICAQSLRGLALVTLGRIDEGMAVLDGSVVAALADHAMNIDLLDSVTCNLLQACNLARDYERSAAWCARILAYHRTQNQEFAFCFCRPAYAFALTQQGKWERADAELQLAIRDLSIIRPAMLIETHIRLAELRRLQGAWEESAALLQRSEADSLSLNGRAALALARGENALAEQLADRYLRKLTPRLRLERMQPLELMLRAQTNQGDLAGASQTLAEIAEIARLAGTTPMRAAAAAARGRVLAASAMIKEAAAAFEDAIDDFLGAGAPYERAVCKLELARMLIALNREDDARAELDDAIAILQNLGASADAQRAQRARDMLDESPARRTLPPSRGHNPNQLTPRECEVLALIAEGKANQEIADLLVLSPRTVERHISTIYEKLHFTGKSARAAATAWALRQGVAPAN